METQVRTFTKKDFTDLVAQGKDKVQIAEILAIPKSTVNKAFTGYGIRLPRASKGGVRIILEGINTTPEVVEPVVETNTTDIVTTPVVEEVPASIEESPIVSESFVQNEATLISKEDLVETVTSSIEDEF